MEWIVIDIDFVEAGVGSRSMRVECKAGRELIPRPFKLNKMRSVCAYNYAYIGCQVKITGK